MKSLLSKKKILFVLIFSLFVFLFLNINNEENFNISIKRFSDKFTQSDINSELLTRVFGYKFLGLNEIESNLAELNESEHNVLSKKEEYFQKNRLELYDIMQDNLFAVVYTLFYDFSVRTKMQGMYKLNNKPYIILSNDECTNYEAWAISYDLNKELHLLFCTQTDLSQVQAAYSLKTSNFYYNFKYLGEKLTVYTNNVDTKLSCSIDELQYKCYKIFFKMMHGNYPTESFIAIINKAYEIYGLQLFFEISLELEDYIYITSIFNNDEIDTLAECKTNLKSCMYTLPEDYTKRLQLRELESVRNYINNILEKLPSDKLEKITKISLLESIGFDALDKINTEDSLFFYAALLSNNNKYDLAKEIFENISEKGSSVYSANADRCLAAMYYYGKGVEVNKTIAINYSKSAYKKGIINEDPNLPNYADLPKKKISNLNYECFRK